MIHRLQKRLHATALVSSEHTATSQLVGGNSYVAGCQQPEFKDEHIRNAGKAD
jgi:hypothetical protein